MNKTRNKPTLLERLKKGPVIVAEGYVFELEKRGYIKAGPYVPEVVLDFPDAVKELHREFLRAGAEVMVAFTYYAHKKRCAPSGARPTWKSSTGRRCGWPAKWLPKAMRWSPGISAIPGCTTLRTRKYRGKW